MPLRKSPCHGPDSTLKFSRVRSFCLNRISPVDRSQNCLRNSYRSISVWNKAFPRMKRIRPLHINQRGPVFSFGQFFFGLHCTHSGAGEQGEYGQANNTSIAHQK